MSGTVGGSGNGPQFRVIRGGAAHQQHHVAGSAASLGRQALPGPALPEQDSSTRVGVRLAASRHQSFESALLSMVHAAGVGGPRAEAVAHAIMANDELRAQAQAAFNGSRLTSI